MVDQNVEKGPGAKGLLQHDNFRITHLKKYITQLTIGGIKFFKKIFQCLPHYHLANKDLPL